MVYPPTSKRPTIKVGRMDDHMRIKGLEGLNLSRLLDDQEQAVFMQLLFRGMATLYHALNQDNYDVSTNDLVTALLAVRRLGAPRAEQSEPGAWHLPSNNVSVDGQSHSWKHLLTPAMQRLNDCAVKVASFDFRARPNPMITLLGLQKPTDGHYTTLQLLLAIDAFCQFAFTGPIGLADPDKQSMLALPGGMA